MLFELLNSLLIKARSTIYPRYFPFLRKNVQHYSTHSPLDLGCKRENREEICSEGEVNSVTPSYLKLHLLACDLVPYLYEKRLHQRTCTDAHN